jgi:Chaperone of endosialidase
VACVIGGWSAYTWIGGGSWNVIERDSDWATICGGFTNCLARGSGYSAIVGGLVNTIEGNSAHGNANIIGAGQDNRIQTNSYVSVIAAGCGNMIETNAGGCAILAGWGNRISKDAQSATVVNGHSNRAGGTNSLAGGYRAKATHNGTYVWADYNESDFASTNANQYRVRASGGVQFFSDSGATMGAFLKPGAGSFTEMSDRNAKENFQPTKPKDVLEKVAALPISTWNYKTQEDEIRHIGPMAQDFYKAFGLGGDERGITNVDAHGVAFAAIQGLYEMLREKDTQLKELQKELKAVKELLPK